MNCLGLDPRRFLLKQISRPVKTSFSYKKSLAGFKNGASTTLSGFVACHVSCTEIFQVIVTQAERCRKWKKAHGPNSKIQRKIHCLFHRNELNLVINIHYKFACTHRSTWAYAHIPLTTRNTENISNFKWEKAFALFHSNSIISWIYLSLRKFLIENILLNFLFSLERTYLKEQ